MESNAMALYAPTTKFIKRGKGPGYQSNCGSFNTRPNDTRNSHGPLNSHSSISSKHHLILHDIFTNVKAIWLSTVITERTMHMKDEFRLRNLLLWLPQQLVDEKNNFFPNSGASNHITSHLSNLLIHSEYCGCEQVVFGNSSSLMILNIGSTSLKHNSSDFHLQNILHCPNVLANLLICINFHKILIVILYSHLMVFCQVPQDGKYVFPRQE